MTELSFGEWLKRQRSGRGFTQAQLAHQIGCAVVTLRKLESEERRPSAQIVARLAEIFEIPKEEQSSFLKYARGDLRYALDDQKGQTPWLFTTKSPRTNLPASVTALIGRERQLAELHGYLLRAEIRLVTLIGPPGMGKTRLSIDAARQSLADFPDGVFFVALAPLDDPALIAPTTLQALGYMESRKLSPEKQLKEGIGEKQMLIVLDNCEHLIGEAAEFAAGLLLACSHLKILATSREALHTPGEWLYNVPPLELPQEHFQLDVTSFAQYPALMLFAERARAVRSDFVLTPDNIQIVAKICGALDGLPLAIELISAQMRLYSPRSLLERLNDQFVLSAEGARSVPARQISLNHAIGWSYDSLAPDEQRLFACQSVFSGGFTLLAAEAIFSPHFTGGPISTLVTSLLDKGLLQRSSDLHGEMRFMMLVTIQYFALNRLRQMGDETEVRNWHLAYFLDLAKRADQEIHGPDQLEWIDRVDDEHDNFRSALTWCVSNQKTETALQLLTSLSDVWLRRDHSHEMCSWFDAIRLLPGIMDYPLLFARLLNHIVHHTWVLGDFDYSRSLLEESRAILTQPGIESELDLAMTFCWFGMVTRIGDENHQAAQPFYARSLELYRKQDDRWGMAFVMFNLGIIANERNEDRLALSLFKQSMDIFRQLDDMWGIARVSQMLAQLFMNAGKFEQAQSFLNQHLMIDEKLAFKQGAATALFNMGNFYRYQGDCDRSEAFYEKMMDVSREYDSKWNESLAYYGLGLTALHRDDYRRSARYFKDYYSMHRSIVEKGATVDLLYAMSAIAAGTNRPEHAAKLYGAAQALVEIDSYRVPSFDLAEFEHHIQIAQAQLGGARFEELASEGGSMTMEQAIEFALEE